MKINYTIVNNAVKIEGVDATNPVMYLNDMTKDVPDPFYIWLKANRKEVNLVGNVSDHNGHPQAGTNEKQPALFQQFNELYNAFKAMGGQNVPAPILGASKNLSNGQTSWENSPGSDKIIAEAKKASAAKPLVIFVGGQATTVANALLKDKTIKDNIIVFHTAGWGSRQMNVIDGWACQVLIDGGVKYIVWDGQLNSWYDGPGSPQYRGYQNPPINRMPGITFANINNVFHNLYKSNFAHMYDAYGSIGDAPPVLYFFNHGLWQNVARRNKQNQTVNDENFAFLLVSQNNWTQYGPQLTSVMNNPLSYIPVTTPVPNQPPSVFITSGNNFTTGNILLTAQASDDQQVTKVEFFVGTTKVGEDTASPYAVTWNAPAGSHIITAKATDNLGVATTSAPVTITVSDIIIPPVEPPISLGKGRADVKDFGVKGDGSPGDNEAFTKAWNSLRGTGGDLMYSPPNNFYNFSDTFQALPDGSNQVWINIKPTGMRSGKIRYTGPGDRPVINCVGLKDSRWEGLKIAIENGRSNVQCIDFHTLGNADSLTGNNICNTYFNLGDGDNQGMRFDKLSGQGGDVSIFNFDNCQFYGAGESGGLRKPEQWAYQSKGPNVLAMNVYGGIVAFCGGVFSNLGAPDDDRGGACWYFFGVHTSRNLCEFALDREGTVVAFGGRFESSDLFLKTAPGNHHIAFTVVGARMNDMKGNGNLFQMNTAFDLKIDNCQMHRQSPETGFTDLVTVSSSAMSTLKIDLGASRYQNLVKRVGGSPNCKVYLSGHKRFVYPNAVNIEKYMDDINGVMV